MLAILQANQSLVNLSTDSVDFHEKEVLEHHASNVI